MIAGEPQKKIFAEGFPYRCPGFFLPVVIRGQIFEGKLFQSDFSGVRPRAGRRLFAAIVLEDLAQGVGQEQDALSGAGASKQIEREEERGGFHGIAALREIGPISLPRVFYQSPAPYTMISD